ncbi:hypothetical protein N7476_000344 [Penicillium atrosanguineum]|uniref:Zn(2)-C6 fungal-type domain-containing protein n=1 Tax=Penicillium atrosanguineum TaxID=1132637 RepID=A0A9W9UBN9_9EURO|nr:hypothetical protein N7476_000344 [Penicillium atrosanguineum]
MGKSPQELQRGKTACKRRVKKHAACLQCRRSKIRCRGYGFPCLTCVTRGIRSECEFASETPAGSAYMASYVPSDGSDDGGQPQTRNESFVITDLPSPSSTETTVSEPSQIASWGSSGRNKGASAKPELSGIVSDQWPDQKISTDAGSLDFEWLTCLFASDTNGAHDALHGLQEIYHQATPDFREAVHLFFQTESVHQLVVHQWRLFSDCEDAVDHQDELQHERELPDVASWCAHNCRDCFCFLLDQGAIRPWYFNSFGHSQFFLVFQATEIPTAHYLISQLSPKHLLAPASIAEAQGQRTILQLAAGQPALFSACFSRLEEWILDLREVLDHQSFFMICRYASARLAGRMYMKGIDIAQAVQDNASLWLGIILHHPDPASLLDWLRKKGCLPPCFGQNQHSLLEVATQHDRLEAAQWLLSQTNDPAEYRKCAMEAARRQTEASVRIFDCAMSLISLMDGLNSVSEDAACVIIYSTCDSIRGAPEEERHSVENISMRKVMTLTSSKVIFDESVISYVQSANLPWLANMMRSF